MYKIKMITKDGIFLTKESFETVLEAKQRIKLMKKIDKKEAAGYIKYSIVERRRPYVNQR